MLYGDPVRQRALLARAADAGLDHLFVADHVSFHQGIGMDGLVQATIATSIEPRLPVYVGVYLLALRRRLHACALLPYFRFLSLTLEVRVYVCGC